MKQLNLRIDGMTCSHCAKRVHDAILAVDDVHVCEVELKRNQARVSLGESVDMGAVFQAVSNAGYRLVGFSQVEFDAGQQDEASS